MASSSDEPPHMPAPKETFQTLWAEALRKFQQSTDVPSTRWDSLLHRMSDCHNEDDVCAVLDEIMQKLEHFRVGDPKWSKIRNKYMKPAIQVLLLFNDAIAEVASSFPTVPGGKAIFVGFAVLLEASKGVAERCDALIGLFEELNAFLESLRVRLSAPSSIGPSSKTISIMILTQLLNIFVMATNIFSPSKWRIRRTLFRDALVKDTTLQDALKRLQKLRDLETKATVAETGATVSELKALVGRVSSEIASMKQRIEGISYVKQQHRTENDISRLLDKLDRVGPADIDAQNSNGCLAGTRVDILTDLMSWSRDTSAPQIYWLNGMAGTGKSAISRTFCRDLREANLLGGSFFCTRRGTLEEADVRRIIPSLAVCMALRDMHCTLALLAELDVNAFSRHWNLDLQIERLLRQPFSGIEAADRPLPVLVVDALDECSDQDLTRDWITKLVLVARKLPVKLFLTSRPEPHIRQHLELLDPSLGQVLRLHDVEQDIVGADIGLFLRHGLESMRPAVSQGIPDWPMKSDIDTLTHLSGKLFIYAFTALMYIRKDPIERLSKLTGTTVIAGRAMTQPLDTIYDLILKEAMDPRDYDDDEIERTRRMIAIIICIREPVTVAALAELLQVPSHRIRQSLDRLYAVIYVPLQDNIGHLSTFHASFGDFLTIKGRAPEYMRSCMHDSHIRLSHACLLLLQSDKLRFNISNAITSYQSGTVQSCDIDDVLRYAALYWSKHIHAASVLGGGTVDLLIVLEKVLVGPKFMFWLEVLCAVDRSRDAYEILSHAHELTQAGKLESFIKDAMVFVHESEPAIRRSSPHIYLSALALCPPSSAVSLYCMPYFTGLAKPIRRVHLPSASPGSKATAATFSLDGSWLIIGFEDGTVRTWDTRSGKLITESPQRLHMRPISLVAVSPNKCRIFAVSHASFDLRLSTWGVEPSIELVETICTEAHINLFALSPDGLHVAFGLNTASVPIMPHASGYSNSPSYEVRLWDLTNGI
ncbi:hypothetical protein PENSPDRAFT_363435, partial [Peniophora sp. CONT]